MKRVEQVRREHDATGRIGFMRYRLTLINGNLMELTECVEVQAGEIVRTKYRHHWQNREGLLIKRWDNTPQYPQVASFPHHLHDGSEDNVVAHPPVQALEVLCLVVVMLEQ